MFSIAVHRDHATSLYECEMVQSYPNRFDQSRAGIWQSPTLSMFTNGVCTNIEHFEKAFVMNAAGKTLQTFRGSRGPEEEETDDPVEA